jgi:hypothetical protein
MEELSGGPAVVEVVMELLRTTEQQAEERECTRACASVAGAGRALPFWPPSTSS